MRVILLFVLLLPSALFAEGFIPKGKCVVVLASKPTLQTARDDVRRRFLSFDTTIYRSSNGWYAITGPRFDTATQLEQLAALKRQGAIPQDAICSSGARYVERMPSDKSQHFARQEAKQSLFDPFSSAGLSFAEKRFLQLALAFEGDYIGLVDGAWGRRSDEALRSYARREFGSMPEEWHAAALTFGLANTLDNDDWRYHYNEVLDMSYIFPFGAYKVGAPSENFVNFEHTTSSLKLSITKTTQKKTSGLHQYVYKKHQGRDEVYQTAKPKFAVTASRLSNGGHLYIRSHKVGRLWSSVMVSVQKRDQKILRAFTSSMKTGRASNLQIEKNGRLSQTISAIAALAAEKEGPPSASANPMPSNVGVVPDAVLPKPLAKAPTLFGTGSGFVVSSDGHILTNEHVVEECTQVKVDGEFVSVLAADEKFDLALLHGSEVSTDEVAKFAIGPAPLNSDITVLGYPLSGLLGGLNVTRGSLSSLKGLLGDANQMQITAPIQPGNSGGPALDRSGAVIGVVVSKLKAAKNADGSLDLRQNVNFAIRGEIAKLFLGQNGVPPLIKTNPTDIRPVELATQAAKYTKLIECYK